MQAIRSDGGSEFLKEFGPTVKELQLALYFNRPNYPQGNGRIERSFRTDEEEFYQVEELPADLGGLEAVLLAWNRVYETVRPHQALGYKTPEQFYRSGCRSRWRGNLLSPYPPPPRHRRGRSPRTLTNWYHESPERGPS